MRASLLMTALTALSAPVGAQALDLANPLVRFGALGAGAVWQEVVDVDGDGRPDLLTIGGAVENSIQVRLALPGGDFAPTLSTQIVGAALFWGDRATGDVDGDGHLDLVSTGLGLLGGGDLAAMLGQGDGRFTAGGSFALDAPGPVTLGDVDADGRDDALMGIPGSSDVLLLRSAPGGGWSAPTTLAAGMTVSDLVTGDVDGDGDLDVVVASGAAGGANLAWLPGDGSGGFAAPITSAAGDGITQLLLADLDGDGALSALLRHSSSPDVRVVSDDQLLAGGSALVLPGAGPCPFTRDLTVGDLDDDGDLDIGLLCRDSLGRSHLVSFLGDGGGGFLPAAVLPLPDSLRIDATDLNRDGDVDLVIGDSASVGVMAGDGQQGFQGLHHVPEQAGDLLVDDLDGDGRLDVVVTHGLGLSVRRGRPFGRLSQAILTDFDAGAALTALSPGVGALGDGDGDGRIDVLFGSSHGGASGNAGLFPGAGDGSFIAPPQPFSTGMLPYTVRVGDLEGDGDLDGLFVAGDDLPVTVLQVETFLNDGSGGYTAAQTLPGCASTLVELADVDVDGDLDLLRAGTSGLELLANDGSGQMLATSTLAAGGTRALAVGDYDTDGVPDVFLRTTSAPGHQLLISDGDLTFTQQLFVTTPGLGVGGLFVDVTGDGLRDIVSLPADLATNKLFVQPTLANGEVDVASTSSHEIDDVPKDVAAGDLDGDGATDLFVLSQGTLQVLLSRAGPWTDLGQALPGSTGLPRLRAEGPLTPGSDAALLLSDGRPLGSTAMVVGFTALEAAFKGGTLVPFPDVLVIGVPLDADGGLELHSPWPAGVPSGFPVWWQFWTVDPAAVSGLSASNALLSVAP